MEVYRNATDAKVTLRLPDDVITAIVNGGALNIFAVENGVVLQEFQTAVLIAGVGYQLTLPWALTRQDRDLFIDWEMSYYLDGAFYQFTERSEVQIVTPLLPLEEVATIAGLDLVTQRDDVVDLERKVRYVIQSNTGQNFGKFYGVMRSSGNGSNRLQLPAPLLEFVAFSFDGLLRPNYGVRVINDGWALASGEVEITSIKQAPPEWMLDRFDYTGKIYAPLKYGRHAFMEGVEYTVEGMWGYNDVPANVRQAARLLVQDYSCDESLWRDRYIQTVQAADWRFRFAGQAFSGTGNVQADQLLSGYRRQTMAVI